MDIKFYENLLLGIRKRRSIYSERLLSGTFEALAEYKLVVGKLKGLEEAETLLKELFKGTYSISVGDTEDGNYERVL